MPNTIKEPTLRDIAFEGKGTINIMIDGLDRWNDSASVDISIKRTHTDGWSYLIDSPSYSVKVKKPEAWSNFAEALRQAGDKIEQYVALEDKMDIIFQEGETFRIEEGKRLAEEAEAKKNADGEVGKKLANRVINEMRRIAKSELTRWETANIKVVARGTRKESEIKVTHSYRGLTLFSLGYHRISRVDAVQMVADSFIDGLEVHGIGMPDPKVVNFLLAKSKK